MENSTGQNYKSDEEKLMEIVKKVAVGLVLTILFFQSVGTIGAGQRGIMMKFGAVTGQVLNEGLYFKIPFIQNVKSVDIRVQKEEVVAPSASKDLQSVQLVVALNYSLKSDMVAEVYQNIGTNYKSTLIIPAIQESVKASTAQFTAEELITKRQEVGSKIKVLLIERLEKMGITVDEISIVDLDFSKSFNTSIEAKVKAEQDALTSQNKLEQIKFEAEQRVVNAQGIADARIAEAKAEAEAIKIQVEAITNQGGEDYIRLKALEAWDGELPNNWYGGSVLPFIGVQ
ncbi:MAG: prohibitin family protein [Candidatus Peribacteraceae bacterium]|nr:prohibitin family protein [Candidatus Peribacteraceae bacterium]